MNQSVFFYHEKSNTHLSNLKLVYRQKQDHHLHLEYFDILQWPIHFQKKLTAKMSQETLIHLIKEVKTYA